MKYLREWNELLTLPVALLLWFFIPKLLYYIDPTAGSYDIGVINRFVLATIGLYIGKTIVWLALKIGAPDVYRVLDNFLMTKKHKLNTWQKGIFSLWYYSLLLFCWVIILLAIA